MKLNVLFAIVLMLILSSCQSKKNSKKEDINKKDITKTKGYQLMTQKCFICHFKKPNPAKRSQMVAPPMQRVQEHYKPYYKTKENFVKNVVRFVGNPSKEKTLMPGAVRKFNLMPKLNYDTSEVKLIAEVLYDLNFGNVAKKCKENDEMKK